MADSRRLRVVVMIDQLVLSGGAERLAVQTATRLDPERFHATVCVSRWNPAAAAADPAAMRALEELRAVGGELLGLERRGTTDVRAFAPLMHKLRHDTDILHAHKHGSNVWAAVLGSAARVPVVIAHEHNWSYEGEPLRRFLDRELIARRTDAFLAVSSYNERRMIETEGVRPEAITVLPNGIPRPPTGDPRKLRDELGIDPDGQVVGVVAVLREEKRLDVFVRAIARLAPDFPRLHAVIAGDGPEREALEGLIAELGIGDRLTLLGARRDVPDVLAGLDVAALSSRFEGSPLALMECMAAALPVVSTRVGGVPDLVVDGVTGLLVDPGDDEGMARAIGDLLRDPERAAAMGRRGQDRQQAEFDLGVMVDRMQDLYDRLWDEHAGRRNGRPSRALAADAGELSIEPIESLEAARADWDRLAEASGNPFLTWEWAAAWWDAYGDGELRLFRCCRPDGEVAAVLPMYRARTGPLRVLRFVGHGPADVQGPICAPADVPAAAAALLRLLEEPAGRCDVLLAERTPVPHRMDELLGGTVIDTDANPELRVTVTWEEFVASGSRNFRDQVRRRERKLFREHAASFRLSDDPERLDDDMTTLFRLHAERWDGESTTAFAPARERLHRDFARRALERGWLRLWLLEIDGQAVAAWYGFRYGGAEWYYQSGRDPAWERSSVGFVLMAHTIRSALEDGLRVYHLLRGDESYKSRFANADEGLQTVAVARTALGFGALAGIGVARRLPPGLKRIALSAARQP